MNNNKKYKKWSLGLVAPALVLAPIAVVASCSSSTEEKEAYAIKFEKTQIRAKIHNAIQPNDLTDEQFKEEILNHLDELFSVTGKLPADDFISKNIEIGELQKDNDKKEVSAKVKVNNANTDGKAIEETITLTGLGFDLTTLKYDISFKVTEDNQEIPLTGQENVSVTEMNKTKLIELVLTKENKDQILVIDGDNKDDITDEVLASQILKVTELNPTATEGKVTFKLSVEKPKNGAGDTLEKTITFTGFKKETDSTPPATEKFKIKFKADAEFTLEGVSDQSVNNFSDANSLKPVIFNNKEKIFEAEEGNLPSEDGWWTEMLTISSPVLDAANGQITVKISLDNSDTSKPDNSTINKENIVLKGFKKEAQAPTAQETVMNAQLSTVTLGLNGNRAEAKPQITQQWILDRIAILFKQGSDLIKDVNDIVAGSIKTEDVATGNGNPIKIKFKVAANKWYDNTPAEGTTEKEFETTVSGLSGGATTGQLLANKSNATAPLEIGLVDPALAEKTYDEYKNGAATVFTKDFVFKYRKHLLTGDFSKIDAGTANDFLAEYPQSGSTPATFVKVEATDSSKTIKITFKILGAKLVNSPQNADKEYSVIFNGFKGN